MEECQKAPELPTGGVHLGEEVPVPLPIKLLTEKKTSLSTAGDYQVVRGGQHYHTHGEDPRVVGKVRKAGFLEAYLVKVVRHLYQRRVTLHPCRSRGTYAK